MRWRLILPLVIGLTGCHGGSTPSPVPTIPVIALGDPAGFIDTLVCPDGMPAVLEPGCAGARVAIASDPMRFLAHDWSGHTDDQVRFNYRSDDGSAVILSFSYPPHRQMVPGNGDGGDVLWSDGTTVRIGFTQNGDGHGGTVAGYWVGRQYGGTGWVEFWNALPDCSTGWVDILAELAGSTSPTAQPGLNPAYTRACVTTATVPFIISGTPTTVTGQVIVAEHYSGSSIAASTAVERVMFLAGYGRFLWEYLGTTAPTTPLTWRCPGVPPWSNVPAPGWFLLDRRCLTDIETADGSMTGDIYNWPPVGTVFNP